MRHASFISILFALFLSACLKQISESGTSPSETASQSENSSGGGGTTAITPTALANLKLWFVADTGVTKDGLNAVSAWADQSGLGYTATQESVTSKPTWVSNAINGKPSLRFTRLNLLNVASGPAVGTAFTAFFVISFSDTSGTQYFFTWGGAAPGNRDILSISGTLQFNTTISDYSGIPINSFKLIGVTLDALMTTVKFYVNGVAKGSLAAQAISETAIFTFSIGHAGDGFVGDIAEIVLYNTELSSSDRQGVEAYLNSKYALY